MLDHPLAQDDTPPARGTQAVFDLFRQSDLAFLNLEVPLTDRGQPASKLIAMRADPGLAAELRKIGATVVTIANNHALDYGADGLRHTLNVVRGAGVHTVGAGRDLDEAMAPVSIDAQGLRVAFLGFATTLPHGFAARPGVPGIAPIKIFTRYLLDTEAADEVPGMPPYVETQARPEDVERACAAVRGARERADVVIVGLHWGVPHGWITGYQAPLAGYQQPLGRALIDAGAGAIVGHNAHMLHGMERYRGAPILYSLGDLVFHSHAAARPFGFRRAYPPYQASVLRSRLGRLSCVAHLALTRAGVARVSIVPVYLNDDGEPEPASDAVAQEILSLLNEQSAPLGARLIEQAGEYVLTDLAAR